MWGLPATQDCGQFLESKGRIPLGPSEAKCQLRRAQPQQTKK